MFFHCNILNWKAKLLGIKMTWLNYIDIENDTAELQHNGSSWPKMSRELRLHLRGHLICWLSPANQELRAPFIKKASSMSFFLSSHHSSHWYPSNSVINSNKGTTISNSFPSNKLSHYQILKDSFTYTSINYSLSHKAHRQQTFKSHAPFPKGSLWWPSAIGRFIPRNTSEPCKDVLNAQSHQMKLQSL